MHARPGSYRTLVTVSFWLIFAMQALIVLFATTNGVLGTGRTAERIGFFLFVALCNAAVAAVCGLAMLQRWRLRLRIPIDDLVSSCRSMFTVQFAAFFTVILALQDDLRFMAYEIFGIPLIVGAVGALMLFFYIPSHHYPVTEPFVPPADPYIPPQSAGPAPHTYPAVWTPAQPSPHLRHRPHCRQHGPDPRHNSPEPIPYAEHMSSDASTAATPARTPWFLVAVLVLAGIAAALMFAKVASIFDAVRSRYELTEFSAGLAMSLPALTAVALGVSASVIVSRVGERRILLISLILGGALSALQALDMPGWLFLISRVVEGAAHLGIVVSAPVIILKATVPSQHGFVMTVWSLFFGLAFTLSGMIAPMLNTSFGVAGVFLAHAVVMVAIASILALVRMPPSERVRPSTRSEGVVQSHVSAYRDLRAVLPGLVFIAHTFMYTPIITFVPTFVGGDSAGFLLVTLPLASIVGTLLSGLIIRFWTSAGALVTIAYLLVGTTMIVLASLIAHVPVATTIALILMVFSGLIQGATFALIPALSTDPVTNARANGVLTQIGNIGSLAGPPVCAALIAASSTIWPFAALVAVACVVGAIASVIAWRVSRRPVASQRASKLS